MQTKQEQYEHYIKCMKAAKTEEEEDFWADMANDAKLDIDLARFEESYEAELDERDSRNALYWEDMADEVEREFSERPPVRVQEERYNGHKLEALDLIERIKAALENEPDQYITWASVDSMAHLKDLLTTAAQFWNVPGVSREGY